MLGYLVNAGRRVGWTKDLVTAIDRDKLLGSLIAHRQLLTTPYLVKNAMEAALNSVEKCGPRLGLPHSTAVDTAASLAAKLAPHLSHSVSSRIGSLAANVARTLAAPRSWFTNDPA